MLSFFDPALRNAFALFVMAMLVIFLVVYFLGARKLRFPNAQFRPHGSPRRSPKMDVSAVLSSEQRVGVESPVDPSASLSANEAQQKIEKASSA